VRRRAWLRRLRQTTLGGALLLPLAFAALAVAGEATLRVKARLREGPSKNTGLVGWVDPGTAVEIIGESKGWQQVQVPDGRTGWIWREHFVALAPPTPATAPVAETGAVAVAAAAPPPAAAAPPPTVAPAAPTPVPANPTADASLAEQVAALQAEVAALKARTPPASDEIERLRGELARLATAQRQIEERLGTGTASGVTTATTPIEPIVPTRPLEGPAGTAGIFLLVGGVVGWIGALLVRRMRDRRQRIRI
jgi:hypothetical protein